MANITIASTSGMTETVATGVNTLQELIVEQNLPIEGVIYAVNSNLCADVATQVLVEGDVVVLIQTSR